VRIDDTVCFKGTIGGGLGFQRIAVMLQRVPSMFVERPDSCTIGWERLGFRSKEREHTEMAPECSYLEAALTFLREVVVLRAPGSGNIIIDIWTAGRGNVLVATHKLAAEVSA
jgi:hypothetical protein